MKTLYDSLINGTPEYKDNGVIITHPPNATMLRAAKMIKQAVEINTSNTAAMLLLQKREAELLSDLERLHDEIKTLRNTISKSTSIREPVVPLSTENTEGSGI